jgi:hypothetical protein
MAFNFQVKLAVLSPTHYFARAPQWLLHSLLETIPLPNIWIYQSLQDVKNEFVKKILKVDDAFRFSLWISLLKLKT